MSSSSEPTAMWRVCVPLILWAIFMAATAISAEGKDFTWYGALYGVCAVCTALIILLFAFCFESYSLAWRIALPVLVVVVFILAALVAHQMGLTLLEQDPGPIAGIQGT